MASGLAKWAQELTKGVHGYWANGRWTPLAISARHRAKLRKDTLLAGGIVDFDLFVPRSGRMYVVDEGEISTDRTVTMPRIQPREWPYDAPRRPERTRMKGHKVDREAALKQARTVELMEKMPQMLAQMKKRRIERKVEKK